MKQAREFFWDTMNEYCPPESDISAEWFRAVLRGDKKHFKLKDMNLLTRVYQNPSYKVANVYAKAKLDPKVKDYLPNYSKSKLPNRMFLFNILNTVYPHSV